LFPSSKTISFRLVGNAVPPILGEAVGRGVKQYLNATVPARALSPLPVTPKQAVDWLIPAVDAATAAGRLRKLPMDEFKKAWFSIGYLHNWLHPDGASDNGGVIVDRVQQTALLAVIAPQIAAPAYALSGWPTRLVPLANEAARRFQVGSLRLDEYYYSGAQIAGWKWCESNRRSEWARKITN
jgi:DNA (cytosine-5)-methyltransferase 1